MTIKDFLELELFQGDVISIGIYHPYEKNITDLDKEIPAEDYDKYLILSIAAKTYVEPENIDPDSSLIKAGFKLIIALKETIEKYNEEHLDEVPSPVEEPTANSTNESATA